MNEKKLCNHDILKRTRALEIEILLTNSLHIVMSVF